MNGMLPATFALLGSSTRKCLMIIVKLGNHGTEAWIPRAERGSNNVDTFPVEAKKELGQFGFIWCANALPQSLPYAGPDQRGVLYFRTAGISRSLLLRKISGAGFETLSSAHRNYGSQDQVLAFPPVAACQHAIVDIDRPLNSVLVKSYQDSRMQWACPFIG